MFYPPPGDRTVGSEENMNKQTLLRCIIVSCVTAIIASFISITISTKSIKSTDLDTTMLREHGFEDTAQWSETNTITNNSFASFIHTLRYPGFWVFWFRGFRIVFLAVFLGTISVTIWNERKKDDANQKVDHISKGSNTSL